jgi:hypothetical protein
VALTMETKPKNGKMQRGLIVLVGGNGSQPFPVVGRLVGELRGAVLPEPNGDPTRHGEDVIMGDAAHRGARSGVHKYRRELRSFFFSSSGSVHRASKELQLGKL